MRLTTILKGLPFLFGMLCQCDSSQTIVPEFGSASKTASVQLCLQTVKLREFLMSLDRERVLSLSIPPALRRGVTDEVFLEIILPVVGVMDNLLVLNLEGTRVTNAIVSSLPRSLLRACYGKAQSTKKTYGQVIAVISGTAAVRPKTL